MATGTDKDSAICPRAESLPMRRELYEIASEVCSKLKRPANCIIFLSKATYFQAPWLLRHQHLHQ